VTKDIVLEVQKPAGPPILCASMQHDFYNSLQHQTPGGHQRQEAAQKCVPDNFELHERNRIF
jgi:hypothetical protein